jgi:hypothetical protein
VSVYAGHLPVKSAWYVTLLEGLQSKVPVFDGQIRTNLLFLNWVRRVHGVAVWCAMSTVPNMEVRLSFFAGERVDPVQYNGRVEREGLRVVEPLDGEEVHGDGPPCHGPHGSSALLHYGGAAPLGPW